MFLTIKRHMPAHGQFPLDNFREWPIACRNLKDMEALRSLHVKMIVWDTEKCDGSGSIDDAPLLLFWRP
jgi:hypothetical protein